MAVTGSEPISSENLKVAMRYINDVFNTVSLNVSSQTTHTYPSSPYEFDMPLSADVPDLPWIGLSNGDIVIKEPGLYAFDLSLNGSVSGSWGQYVVPRVYVTAGGSIELARYDGKTGPATSSSLSAYHETKIQDGAAVNVGDLTGTNAPVLLMGEGAAVSVKSEVNSKNSTTFEISGTIKIIKF